MSTDRRYAILHRMMWGARQTLEALDAADREAGYLRLKVDDAAVEKVARVLAIRAEGYDDPAAWGELSDAWRESYRDDARAVLAALRETP